MPWLPFKPDNYFQPLQTLRVLDRISPSHPAPARSCLLPGLWVWSGPAGCLCQRSSCSCWVLRVRVGPVAEGCSLCPLPGAGGSSRRQHRVPSPPLPCLRCIVNHTVRRPRRNGWPRSDGAQGLACLLQQVSALLLLPTPACLPQLLPHFFLSSPPPSFLPRSCSCC